MADQIPAPPRFAPVQRITRPVSVQISSVSNTVAVMEIRPCCGALTPEASAAAMGAVPRPASLENTPLLMPACTVPNRPPVTPAGVKAPRRTSRSTPGRTSARRIRIQKQHSR